MATSSIAKSKRNVKSVKKVAKTVAKVVKKAPQKVVKTVAKVAPPKKVAKVVASKAVKPSAQKQVVKKAKRTEELSKVGVAAKKVPSNIVKPEPKKVVLPPLPPIDPKFLEEQKILLQQEREMHLNQANDLIAEAEALVEEMEPGDTQFDDESGEGGTLSVERERDQFLSAQELAAVGEIDQALERISRKTYGYCEQCRNPIPRARLKVMPAARLCVQCKNGGLSRR